MRTPFSSFLSHSGFLVSRDDYLTCFVFSSTPGEQRMSLPFIVVSLLTTVTSLIMNVSQSMLSA